MSSTLLVGTDKGGYVLTESANGWEVAEPLFPGWRVTAFGRAGDGTHLAGTASGWFGPGIHRSDDLQEWTPVEQGPGYPADGPALEQVWSFATAPDGTLWCGVAEAGLFRSDDHGVTWAPVPAFNEHPTRDQWQPGAGGMCLHRIILDGDRIWAAASAIGVFRSDDGAGTFVPRNAGVDAAVPDGGPVPEVGYCVHSLVGDPDDPSRLWQQNHKGVFRSTDSGDSWTRIETGLPAAFGFPMVRDGASGNLFVAPLSADTDRTPVDGDFAVYRSTDDGDSWHRSGTGWPAEPTYDSVLRGAMVGDDDGGIWLGTTSGQVWCTRDSGDIWTRLPGVYPRINALAVVA